MESIGLIVVSIIPSYENTIISIGVLNSLSISSFVNPFFFAFLYRSVCFIALFSEVCIASSLVLEAKGAVFFPFMLLKNLLCNSLKCSSTASSAYCCILESIVVYIFNPSLYMSYFVPSGFGFFSIKPYKGLFSHSIESK